MTPLTISPTRTPDTLTPKLLEACRRLVASAEPVFVQKQLVPDTRVNKCTLNVRDFLKENSGEMVLGWDVAVWDNVLLDCVGHAVVRQGDALMCITPSKYGASRLLFLPDPSLSFDFSDPNARMPVSQIAISARVEVANLIRATEREREIKIKYPVSSESFVAEGQDAVDLRKLEREKNSLMLKVLLATSDHNTRCSCGSGKKFRKCHRASVEKALALS